MTFNCPFCDVPIQAQDVFCPHCGKKLPDKNLPLSFGHKFKIYFLSTILAPLGMYWFFKYFRSEDPTKKKLAYYVLFITIVMLLLSVALGAYAAQWANSYLGSQLDPSLYSL